MGDFLKDIGFEQMMRIAQELDCFTWVTQNQLQLGSGPYELVGHEYQVGWLQEQAIEQCFIKGAQIGAYLWIETLIPTPSGFVKMKDIKVGDKVFDEIGRVCSVTGAYQIEDNRDCYKITFSTDEEIITDDSHKWRVRNVKYDSYHTLTTKEISEKFLYRGGERSRYAVDVCGNLQLPNADLPIDPYTLGLWLGDGHSASATITTNKEDFEVIKEYIPYAFTPTADKRVEYKNNIYLTRIEGLYKSLRENNLLKNKHIPIVYLRGSYIDRIELLCGLIDSDGYIDKNGSCFFYNSNYRLIGDVYELVNSLGIKAKINYRGVNDSLLPGGKIRQSKPTDRWEVYFKPHKVDRASNLPRKYNRQVEIKRIKESNSRYITNVERTITVPVRCISVDSESNLYLIGRSFIPTHNTECLVLRTMHGLIMGRYNQGALYLFPTRDDVGDFSKSRFDPLIDINPFIGAFVTNTDAQNIKQVGSGHLYLRGARSTKNIKGSKKSSSQLKSIAVDRVVFDEMDEIEPEMVELAKERISHSRVKELVYLGTPTIPDYGIDAKYQKSDQRVWMIVCEHCGKETCLDLEFPNSLQRRTDGSVYRCCIHCKKEIFPANGRWVAQYPDRSKDLVGWWISQLNSIFVSPKLILDLYEDPPNGDLSEVMNSKLGRAYIPAENRLHPNEVYACCGNDPILQKHEGPCCMGVDVGKVLHVVIAERSTKNALKVVKVTRVDNFEDLHDLAKNFNVKSCVIDLRPEQRKVREFQKAENYSVFGCEYVETRTGLTHWDDKDKVIKCNRTEICDATHELVVETGRLELPRRSFEVEEFTKEMCNIAKTLEEDELSGAKAYRYKKLGPDHYRHALNYCLLASERVGVVSDKFLINRFFGRRHRKTWMSA